ncbi:transposase [Kutzneria sp. 744]|nr:transposase [Kutzneria sp. 744]
MDSRCSTTGHPDAGVAGVRALADMLDGIADPRKLRGIRHQISAVLTVMVLAVLAGARNFREIADRSAELPSDLLTLAGCRVHPRTGEHVVPSAATIRRVAHGIDADATDHQVSAWLRAEALARTTARDAAGVLADTLVAVAMDGKTIRNTIEPGGPEGNEIKLFSALTHAEAIVIAQHRIPAGTNEITQVPALLDGVDLRGVVVTGDAAHACHGTASHITTERGGHYVLTVKGNHPGLLAQATAVLPPAAPGSEHHVTDDRGHGRVVRRAIWVAPADGVDFPGVAQVFRIRRDTFDHLGRRLSKEVVHGVTSLTAERATPEQIAGLVRNHWRIENKSHWVRDVVYREDHQHAYAGTGAQVMATLRNLALGLLRLAGVTQITRTLQRITADRARILPIIAAATNANRH